MIDTAALDLDTEEVRTLVDLGFIAVMRGNTQYADALFRGVRAARPSQDAGYIGEALLFMQKGEVAAATGLLRARPPTDANRVFLGLALLRLGEREQAEQILRDVVATAREPALIELARNIISSASEADRPFSLF